MTVNMIIKKTILEKYLMRNKEKPIKKIHLLKKGKITEHKLERLIPSKSEVKTWI